MNKYLRLSSLCVMGVLLAACGTDGKKAESTNQSMTSFSDSPLVAERKVVGQDTIVVMSLKEIPTPVTVKLSDIVDNPRIIKLDPSPEAMVGEGKIWTDGKYILIYGDNVVKLFDINGEYIGQVGARGNGPGEYSIAPYNIYVDDKAGRICMLQYGAEQIMCYDMQGNFVENIPLAHKVNKGFVKVDFSNNTATVASLLFNSDETDDVVWTQDFQGNIISSVAKPSLALVPDFSSEVYGGFSSRSDNFNYSLFDIEGHSDTLYNYRDNTLRPDFTVDFGDASVQHQYLSFPEFYIVTTFGEPKMVSENSYIIPANLPFMVDKKSLKGAPAKLMLDNLGTLTLDNSWQFQESPDYFIVSYDPGVLLDMLEEAPAEHPLASEEGVKKMNELKASITPDDNNYIIFGPWKRP